MGKLRGNFLLISKQRQFIFSQDVFMKLCIVPVPGVSRLLVVLVVFGLFGSALKSGSLLGVYNCADRCLFYAERLRTDKLRQTTHALQLKSFQLCHSQLFCLDSIQLGLGDFEA